MGMRMHMLRMLEINSSGPLHVSALSQLRAGVAVVFVRSGEQYGCGEC